LKKVYKGYGKVEFKDSGIEVHWIFNKKAVSKICPF
jgi:hypothetical protein